MAYLASFRLLCIVCCTSCTISFQNISTNGKAEDLVDEEQTASPSTSVDATIPMIP